LRSRDRFAGLRTRRAIVKVRLVRTRKGGVGAARAHLRYLQRDGVQRDGSPGQLYSERDDRADGPAFLGRCADDRHQFRLILSCEDGDSYDDLKPLVRRFMSQMERDLGTSLEWVAVDHVDTGRPHSHVILRGRDETGQNLVIARDYIANGMRERLAELVTIDLGPRQDLEIATRLRQDVGAERLTRTDRSLLREAGRLGTVSAHHRDPLWHALRAGRLRKLQSMGLASDLGEGRWRLADGLQATLRDLGERSDLIRTMQRAMKAAGLARGPADTVVHGGAVPAEGIIGRLVERGLADELTDRHYLLVDATDGRIHRVLVDGASLTALPPNSIVELSNSIGAGRSADKTIGRIAAKNAGIYSAALHAAIDPAATPDYLEAHVRRLEAVRRAGAGIDRLADGRWRVGGDFAEVAANSRRAGVQVDLVSPLPLEQLPGHEGAGWLDRMLVEGDGRLRGAGFGGQVKSALQQRQQWLVEAGFAKAGPDGLVIDGSAPAELRRREIARAAVQLSADLKLPFAATEEGGRVGGVLAKRIDLVSGSFALVENGREFTLVPWRPVLERRLGQEVAGTLRKGSVNWTFGRSRGIEI